MKAYVKYRYRYNFSLTLALDGVGCLRHTPRLLFPWEMTWYQLYRRLVRLQGWSGQVQKFRSHRD